MAAPNFRENFIDFLTNDDEFLEECEEEEIIDEPEQMEYLAGKLIV